MATDSIKKNYILNTAFQVFRLIIPLVTAPYISRVFEPEGIGIRSFTTSIMSVFLIFAVLGTNSYGQQTIAQCRDNRTERSNNFWGIFFVCLITTLVTTVCWLIVVVLNKDYRIYLLILTIQIIASAFDISWYFAALERFSEIVFRNILIKSVIVVLLFIFIKKKEDLALYIAFESIGILICNLSMWISLTKSIERPMVRLSDLRHHFRQTLVYFLPTIAASVYSYIDKTMIGVMTHSKAENGYYEQAQSIANMAYVLVASLNTVMASRNAYLFSKNKTNEVKKRLSFSLAFILTLAIPLTFGIFGVSEDFVPWFFGPGYDKVVFLLKLCSPLVILLAIHNYLAAQYLVPSGQRARSTKGVIAGAVINFVCNAVLITYMQSAGAVIATLIAELSMCGIYAYMSKEYVSLSSIFKEAGKPIIASSIMLTIVLGIGKICKPNAGTTLLQITIGAIIYFVMLILLKNSIVTYGFDLLATRIRLFKD